MGGAGQGQACHPEHRRETWGRAGEPARRESELAEGEIRERAGRLHAGEGLGSGEPSKRSWTGAASSGELLPRIQILSPAQLCWWVPSCLPAQLRVPVVVPIPFSAASFMTLRMLCPHWYRQCWDSDQRLLRAWGSVLTKS